VLYDLTTSSQAGITGRLSPCRRSISGLTVEAIGGTAKDKGKNIYALGLIAKMFDLDIPKLENFSANASPAKTRAS